MKNRVNDAVVGVAVLVVAAALLAALAWVQQADPVLEDGRTVGEANGAAR